MQRLSATGVTDMSTDDRLANNMTNFSAEAYLDTFTLSETISANKAAFYKGLATMYHEVFSTHPAGERLLDVGSGPTLWHVMSASAKYKSITLSDPLPQNRHMQKMYMNDVKQDSRWTEHFKLTARLEGNEEKWPEIGTRLRSCISDVIWCDVNADPILGQEQAHGLYDCVISSLCIEAACTDIPSYNRAVKRLASLGKPGASIVIGGVLKESFYQFRGSRFECMYLPPDIIQNAIKAAGCTVTRFLVSDETDENADNEGIYVVEAHK